MTLDQMLPREGPGSANHIATLAAKAAAPPPPAPTINKFQEFGRQYWPAFAALEVGAVQA